jgi:hypothetical protein
LQKKKPAIATKFLASKFWQRRYGSKKRLGDRESCVLYQQYLSEAKAELVKELLIYPTRSKRPR